MSQTTTTDSAPEPVETIPGQDHTEQPEETQQPTQDDAQQAEEQDQKNTKNPNAEAKKYRLKLRETETELETARSTITELQDTVLADRLKGTISITPQTGSRAVNEDGTTKAVPVQLREPSDLFSVGEVDRNSLFTSTGALDTEALAEATSALHASRPDLFTTPTSAVKSISNQPELPKMNSDWQSFLQGN